MKTLQNASNVQVIYGVEGIKGVYEACLQAKEADFMCTSTNYSQVIGKWYDEEFAPRLFASSLKTREILEDSKGNREYAESKPAKNQVRFVDSRFVSEADVVCWDDKAALVSYDPRQPMVVLIEDGEVARALQNMFGALWEKLK